MRIGTGRWAHRFAAAGVLAVIVAIGAVTLPAAPAMADTVTELSGSTAHTCQVTNGVMSCWGANASGQLGINNSTDQARRIRVNTTGLLNGLTITDVAAGATHSCALSSVGGVYCWGDNSFGQLGDGSTTSSTVPVAVDTSVTFSAVTAGDFHTCGLSTDGSAYCWGRGLTGALGNGSNINRLTPHSPSTSGVLGGLTLVEITAGSEFTCVLSNTGAVLCWGANLYGQLGNDDSQDSLVPVTVGVLGPGNGREVSTIEAGHYHACGIVAGNAYCWGNNIYGQVGNASTATAVREPARVNTTGLLDGVTLDRISTGNGHTCALSTAGTAYCWGRNSQGALGDGGTTDASTAVAVDTTGLLSGVALSRIAAGDRTTCAATAAGVAYCWGRNSVGQLGDSTTSNSPTPVQVLDAAVAPDPPTAVNASAGDEEIAVGWTAPVNPGSAAVTSYTATATGGAQCTATAPTTECTITGLTNGNSYTVTVTATSADGTSEPSAPSDSVTPREAPGAPVNVQVSPGDGQITASWTAPQNFGTGTLTGYTAYAKSVTLCNSNVIVACAVSTAGSAHCTTTGATSCTISGLPNGTTHVVRVRTHTSAASSDYSLASSLVTPGKPELPATVPTANAPLDSSAGTGFNSQTRTTTLTGSGFAPNTPVVIAIYSTPSTLATTTSNSTGAISVTVTIPAGYSSSHTLVATGEGPGGVTHTLTLAINVSGGLAATGPMTIGVLLLGTAMLVTGTLAVLAFRRRRFRFVAA